MPDVSVLFTESLQVALAALAASLAVAFGAERVVSAVRLRTAFRCPRPGGPSLGGRPLSHEERLAAVQAAPVRPDRLAGAPLLALMREAEAALPGVRDRGLRVVPCAPLGAALRVAEPAVAAGGTGHEAFAAAAARAAMAGERIPLLVIDADGRPVAALETALSPGRRPDLLEAAALRAAALARAGVPVIPAGPEAPADWRAALREAVARHEAPPQSRTGREAPARPSPWRPAASA